MRKSLRNLAPWVFVTLMAAGMVWGWKQPEVFLGTAAIDPRQQERFTFHFTPAASGSAHSLDIIFDESTWAGLDGKKRMLLFAEVEANLGTDSYTLYLARPRFYTPTFLDQTGFTIALISSQQYGKKAEVTVDFKKPEQWPGPVKIMLSHSATSVMLEGLRISALRWGCTLVFFGAILALWYAERERKRTAKIGKRA